VRSSFYSMMDTPLCESGGGRSGIVVSSPPRAGTNGPVTPGRATEAFNANLLEPWGTDASLGESSERGLLSASGVDGRKVFLCLGCGRSAPGESGDIDLLSTDGEMLVPRESSEEPSCTPGRTEEPFAGSGRMAKGEPLMLTGMPRTKAGGLERESQSVSERAGHGMNSYEFQA
jgi:hypothetical protein